MDQNMKEAVAIRKIVARFYLDNVWRDIVVKGGDAEFRIEYHLEDMFDYSVYPKKMEDEIKHFYKQVKVFHIVHESSGTEIKIVNFNKYDEPTKQIVLESIVDYGLKKGTLKRE
tara:strand:- start:39 stop:380 length:342 start_codon:yes stop_codon:yes gene_type:complete